MIYFSHRIAQLGRRTLRRGAWLGFARMEIMMIIVRLVSRETAGIYVYLGLMTLFEQR